MAKAEQVTDNVVRLERWLERHPQAKYRQPPSLDGEHLVTYRRPDGETVEAGDRDLGRLMDYLDRQ